MKQPTEIGMNRTGVATSPLRTAEMLKDMMPPNSPGEASRLFAIRSEYLAAPEPIGTMPIPTTLRGVAQTVIQTLKGDRPEVFLDKLGERAAFERTGTRLYDLLLNKCRGQPQEQDLPVESFQTIRDEEARHFELVVRVIGELGGDPTVMTPGADVNAVMSLGLVQVLADPRVTVEQSLQAILLAELADNEAWPVLIELSTELGLDEATGRFREALAAEERHLTEIRTIFKKLVRGESALVH